MRGSGAQVRMHSSHFTALNAAACHTEPGCWLPKQMRKFKRMKLRCGTGAPSVLRLLLGDASNAFRSNKRTLALGALVDLEWFLFQGSYLQNSIDLAQQKGISTRGAKIGMQTNSNHLAHTSDE